MHRITVGNLSIDVVRKDIKNLHLGVYPPNGRVRIATPLKIDDEAVSLFAITKMAWIRKQQLKFETQERQSERGFVSGESHYYKGRRYLLTLTPHQLGNMFNPSFSSRSITFFGTSVIIL